MNALFRMPISIVIQVFHFSFRQRTASTAEDRWEEETPQMESRKEDVL